MNKHELVSAYSQVTYLISGDSGISVSADEESTITVLKDGNSRLQ